MTKIQRGVKNRQCFISCHVDLVEYPEAAVNRTVVDRAGAKCHPAAIVGISSDQIGCVNVDMEADIPERTSEQLRQILGKDILAGRLRSRQQQIFPAQQRGNCLLPDACPIVTNLRLRDPPAGILRNFHGVICLSVFGYTIQQHAADSFLTQKLHQAFHRFACTPLLSCFFFPSPYRCLDHH